VALFVLARSGARYAGGERCKGYFGFEWPAQGEVVAELATVALVREACSME